MRNIVVGFLIIFASMIAASFLAIHVVIEVTEEDELSWYRDRLLPPLEKLADRVGVDGENSLTPGELEELGRDFGLTIGMFDEASILRNYDDGTQILKEIDDSASASAVVELDLDGDDRIVGFKQIPDGRILVLGVPEEPPINAVVILLFALITGFFAAVTTSILVFWPTVRRMRVLEQTAVVIQGGDLSRRADVEGSDAIGRFAHRFNRMSEQLQYHVKRQEEILSAISHELRTPISRIRFSLDLYSRATDQDKRQHYEQRLDSDLDVLDSLIDELLIYARFDSSPRALRAEEFPVKQVVEEIIAAASSRFPSVDLVDQVTRVAMVAERRYFHRAISNLVENALRFADEKVTITGKVAQDHFILDVINDGPPVPEDHREAIFEAFHRVDSSRNRRSGGIGLGLWIVRQIMKAHGGVVTCLIVDDGQTCFRTEWPLDIGLTATNQYNSPTQV